MENLYYFLNANRKYFNLNVSPWKTWAICSPIITTTQSALRPVYSLFQSEFCAESDLVLPLQISSIFFVF